jgi:hypothetical protein
MPNPADRPAPTEALTVSVDQHDPGETDTTIGFCANRTMSGSQTVTFVGTEVAF